MLQIFQAYVKLAYHNYWKNQQHTKKLFLELNGILKEDITVKTNKRISQYTSLSCITNSWFITLRGSHPSEKETKAALYVGAITPLLDDMTDSLGKTSTEIRQIISEQQATAHQVEIKLITYLFNQMKEYCSEDFHRTFDQVLLAQDESIVQTQQAILSHQKIIDITQRKGGLATLIYRQILNNPFDKLEEQAIMTLGFLLQIINDIFDIYKDSQNSQQTLATKTDDIVNLYSFFLERENEFLSEWSQLEYPNKNKLKSLREITVILGRGHVCFNQLIKLQKLNDNIFSIESFERKELICDMEKVSNIYRAARYSSDIMSRFIKLEPTQN